MKLAQMGVAAFHMVERSNTADKGPQKAQMSMDFTLDMLGGCQDPQAAEARRLLMIDPEVRNAFNEMAAGYTKFQNLIAKKAQAK